MTLQAVATNKPSLSPSVLMEMTVGALIEVGKTMQDIVLQPQGAVTTFESAETAGMECGSCISLSRPGKSWNLALFGTGESCRILGRALLAMDPTEELGPAELADALGEILNMMAGVAKRKMPSDEAKSLQLGLPLFLSGTDCFRYLAKGIKVYCQKVAGPDVHVEVIIVWKEGE
jgi:hypothetical protein